MIKSIYINNFKSINELKIISAGSLNVLIGENNVGKTSIFEAIHLWKICYDTNIQKNRKLFYASPKNILFADNEYLRAFEDTDLFNKTSSTSKDIIVSLEIIFEEQTYNLGFKITKPTMRNAYLQVSYLENQSFIDFSNKVKSTSFNLTTVLVISESRPIANIIAKEPYMYKKQVLDKISRGKGYEVLRNKIVKSAEIRSNIEAHITNIMEKEYQFKEVDKENKTYIQLLANNINILSQGSGFLQIAEIFSSLEYSEAGIYILLIDEPDSHLHGSLQRNLIQELRIIQNSQIFVITHNDKFLDNISDEEILFIDNKRKEQGEIKALKKGYKNLIVSGLYGSVSRVNELIHAHKVVLCEGFKDVDFYSKLLDIYSNIQGIELPCIYIEELIGIDTLNDKLLSYSRAYAELVNIDAGWIIIRDTDCVPISKQNKFARKNKQYITAERKEIIFQDGYGLESSLVSDENMFSKLLLSHYELDYSLLPEIIDIVHFINLDFSKKVKVIDEPIHKELNIHFNRQKKERKDYEEIEYRDMLVEINETNIEYIMTKPILNIYLESIHEAISQNYSVEVEKLDYNTLITFYLGSINQINDIYTCHQETIRKILESN